MPHATKQGFGNTALAIEPFEPNPEVSVDIQQTLARLMIWDEANDIWRPVASDIDGRLVISMAGVSVNIAINRAAACGVAATLLLASNPQRRKFVIYNNAAILIYLGFTNGVTAVNGFPLPAGAAFVEEAYSGEIWGIAPGGPANTRIMEF